MIEFDNWSQLSVLDVSAIITPVQLAMVSSDLEHFRLDDRELRDSDIEILRNQQRLKRVELTTATSLTNKTIESLVTLRSLEHLQITHRQSTTNAFAHLKNLPNLEHLSKRNSPRFSGNSLALLDLTGFHSLNFDGCDLSPIRKEKMRNGDKHARGKIVETTGLPTARSTI